MKFKLLESKQDWINFENKFGVDLADKFQDMRNKLRSPENDIYYWMKKPVKDLEDFLSEAEQGFTSRIKADEGAKLLFKNPQIEVYEITNFTASHYYGKATHWCISGRYNGNWNKSAIHWNNYANKGIKHYFIFDKTEKVTMNYTNDETGKKFTETDYAKYAISVNPTTQFENSDFAITSYTDEETDDILELPNAIIKNFPDVKDVPALHELYERIHKYDNVDFNNYIYDGTEIPKEIKYRIKGITIKDGVIEIADRAFAKCTNLTFINISDSVTKIGRWAFSYCKNLREINIPDNITEIEDYAFTACVNLESMSISKNLIILNDSVFLRCESLIAIDIPDSVRKIGDCAFEHCINLTKAVIPDSVKEIHNLAFIDCPKLTLYTNNPLAVMIAEKYDIPYKSLSEYVNESYRNILRFRLVESFLTEDIEAVKKYYPNITDDIFYALIESDPTYIEGKDSVGNYGKWILNLYKKDKIDLEDLNEITELLTLFDENKKAFTNKDINQFKSIEDIRTAVETIPEIELSHRQGVRQRQKARASVNIPKEAKLVYEDNDWEVWNPLTYEASCKLGQDTRWCTATTESDEKYKEYIADGELYININKHTKEKYQFYFGYDSYEDPDTEFKDMYNNNIDLPKFFLQHGNEKMYNFYRDLFVDYNVVEMEQVEEVYEQIKPVYYYPSDFNLVYGTYNNDLDYEDIQLEELKRSAMKVIKVEQDVRELRSTSFLDCTSVTDILIPDSVKIIDYHIFNDCPEATIHCSRNSYAYQIANEFDMKVIVN